MAIADAVVDAVGDAAGRVTVVDTDCRGVLTRAGSCDVEVAYDPVPGEDTTGVVLVTARDGSALLEVDLEAAGPVPPTEPDDPTPTDDPSEPDETTTPDDTPTEAGATGTDPGNTAWPVAVLLAGEGFVAVAWWRRRRGGPGARQRGTNPPRSPASQSPPHVGVRTRSDAGTQAVQPAGDPVVSIRARMRPDEGSTVLHDSHAGEGRTTTMTTVAETLVPGSDAISQLAATVSQVLGRVGPLRMAGLVVPISDVASSLTTLLDVPVGNLAIEGWQQHRDVAEARRRTTTGTKAASPGCEATGCHPAGWPPRSCDVSWRPCPARHIATR